MCVFQVKEDAPHHAEDTAAQHHYSVYILASQLQAERPDIVESSSINVPALTTIDMINDIIAANVSSEFVRLYPVSICSVGIEYINNFAAVKHKEHTETTTTTAVTGKKNCSHQITMSLYVHILCEECFNVSHILYMY